MCGNNFYEQASPANIGLCNNPCPGSNSDMCGGIVCGGQPSYLSFFNLSKTFWREFPGQDFFKILIFSPAKFFLPY